MVSSTLRLPAKESQNASPLRERGTEHLWTILSP
jgi:hypothetical protein